MENLTSTLGTENVPQETVTNPEVVPEVVHNITTKTANGAYEYDSVLMGRGIDEWVHMVVNDFILLQEHNKVGMHLMYKGCTKYMYDYDVLVAVITSMLNAYSSSVADHVNIERMVEKGYYGWAETYKYWTEKEPWSPLNASAYQKPILDFGHALRDQHYFENINIVPPHELRLFREIARFLCPQLNMGITVEEIVA